ncbi:unnamed protein product [Toxocara canis]|uniref:Reverse transcriptase n=1 Tax=Toxocara canis TaxID=6265 RepID=A0A183U766_TOXCA|nr:unnamed protein product [Toxocara canis]
MSKGDGGKGDARRNYILRIASHIFGLNLVEEKLPTVQPLYKFCDSGTPLLVIARYEQVYFNILLFLFNIPFHFIDGITVFIRSSVHIVRNIAI